MSEKVSPLDELDPDMAEDQFEALENSVCTIEGIRICIMRYAGVTRKEAAGAMTECSEIVASSISLRSFNYYPANEIIRKMNGVGTAVGTAAEEIVEVKDQPKSEEPKPPLEAIIAGVAERCKIDHDAAEDLCAKYAEQIWLMQTTKSSLEQVVALLEGLRNAVRKREKQKAEAINDTRQLLGWCRTTRVVLTELREECGATMSTVDARIPAAKELAIRAKEVRSLAVQLQNSVRFLQGYIE